MAYLRSGEGGGGVKYRVYCIPDIQFFYRFIQLLVGLLFDSILYSKL